MNKKVNPELFKRDNQVNVSKFVANNVPKEFRGKYYLEFLKWDNSLRRLPFRDFPSYSEGVCWMILQHTYENY